ncbi:hypothetical protein [Desulfosporosinus sp. BICA1-9]|uniref:hypothetical protein n=1 Tax=Desulfosporosinus sp. BICA1-9 TaxID=1531958 RepID=UPI0025C0C585|nr:hypothetical protein [Desulfosporosinus sp. BICA1-9]
MNIIKANTLNKRIRRRVITFSLVLVSIILLSGLAACNTSSTGASTAASNVSESDAVLAITQESSPQIIVCSTTDGGQNWEKAEIDTGPNLSPAAKLSFADAEHGWLLAGYGAAMGSEFDELFQTTDGGTTDIKTCANKIAFLYESLDKTFKELMWELSELAAKDPDTHEAYKNKVIDFLARGLKEKM